MIDRTESTATTLSLTGPEGTYLARIENGVVDVQVQTVETYANVRVPVAALASLSEFLGAVASDPASVVPESTPTAPEGEPTPEEEASNG